MRQTPQHMDMTAVKPSGGETGCLDRDTGRETGENGELPLTVLLAASE